MSRSFVVVGADKVARALRAIVPAVRRKYVGPALAAGLEPVAVDARANAPVKSGRLRRAIKVVVYVDGSGRVSAMVFVDPADFPAGDFYPPYVEYGTSKMEGRHYMLRAYSARADVGVRLASAAILAGVLTEASARGKGRR